MFVTRKRYVLFLCCIIESVTYVALTTDPGDMLSDVESSENFQEENSLNVTMDVTDDTMYQHHDDGYPISLRMASSPLPDVTDPHQDSYDSGEELSNPGTSDLKPEIFTSTVSSETVSLTAQSTLVIYTSEVSGSQGLKSETFSQTGQPILIIYTSYTSGSETLESETFYPPVQSALAIDTSEGSESQSLKSETFNFSETSNSITDNEIGNIRDSTPLTTPYDHADVITLSMPYDHADVVALSASYDYAGITESYKRIDPASLTTSSERMDIATLTTLSEDSILATPFDVIYPAILATSSKHMDPAAVTVSPESIHPATLITPSESIHPATLITPSESIHPATLITPSGSIHPATLITPSDSIHPATLITPSESIHPATLITPSGSIHPATLITPSGSIHPATLITSSDSIHPATLITSSDTTHPATLITSSDSTHPATLITSSDTTHPATLITSSDSIHPATLVTSSDSIHPANLFTSSDGIHPATLVTSSDSIHHATLVTSSDGTHPATLPTSSDSIYHATLVTQSDSTHPATLPTSSDSIYHATLVTSSDSTHPVTLPTSSDSIYHATLVTQSDSTHPATLPTSSDSIYHATLVTQSDSTHPATLPTSSDSIYHATLVTSSQRINLENLTALFDSADHTNLSASLQRIYPTTQTVLSDHIYPASLTTSSHSVHPGILTTSSDPIYITTLTTPPHRLYHTAFVTSADHIDPASLTTSVDHIDPASLTTSADHIDHAPLPMSYEHLDPSTFSVSSDYTYLAYLAMSSGHIPSSTNLYGNLLVTRQFLQRSRISPQFYSTKFATTLVISDFQVTNATGSRVYQLNEPGSSHVTTQTVLSDTGMHHSTLKYHTTQRTDYSDYFQERNEQSFSDSLFNIITDSTNDIQVSSVATVESSGGLMTMSEFPCTADTSTERLTLELMFPESRESRLGSFSTSQHLLTLSPTGSSFNQSTTTFILGTSGQGTRTEQLALLNSETHTVKSHFQISDIFSRSVLTEQRTTTFSAEHVHGTVFTDSIPKDRITDTNSPSHASFYSDLTKSMSGFHQVAMSQVQHPTSSDNIKDSYYISLVATSFHPSAYETSKAFLQYHPSDARLYPKTSLFTGTFSSVHEAITSTWLFSKGSNFTIAITFDGNCLKVADSYHTGTLNTKMLQFILNETQIEDKSSLCLKRVECNPNRILVFFKNADKNMILARFNKTFSADSTSKYLNVQTVVLNLTGFAETTDFKTPTEKEILPADVAIIAVASAICVIILAVGIIIFTREFYQKYISERFSCSNSPRVPLTREIVALTSFPKRASDDVEMSEEQCVDEAHPNSYKAEYSTIRAERKTTFPSSKEISPGSNKDNTKQDQAKSDFVQYKGSTAVRTPIFQNNSAKQDYGLIVGLTGYTNRVERHQHHKRNHYHQEQQQQEKQQVEDTTFYSVPKKRAIFPIKGLAKSKAPSCPSLSVSQPLTEAADESVQERVDDDPFPPPRYLKHVRKTNRDSDSHEELVPHNREVTGVRSRTNDNGYDNPVFSDNVKTTTMDSTLSFHF